MIDHDLINKVWHLHSTHPAFVGRPLTNLSMAFLHQEIGLPIGLAFIVVNFTLLFVCGVLVDRCARVFHLSGREALVSVTLFYSSYSICFAFFRSIDTYDDLWQYAAILSSLWALRKGCLIVAGSLVCVAFVARETTALLVPGLFLVALSESGERRATWAALTLVLLPGLIYIPFEALILRYNHVLESSAAYAAEDRLTHLSYNFQGFRYGIESLVSMILVFALPACVTWIYATRNRLSLSHSRLIAATVVTWVINTPIVLLSARAREARVFALPLLFLWPLLGRYGLSLWQSRATMVDANASLRTLAVPFIAAACVAGGISFVLFRPTYAGGFERGFQLYAFAALSLVAWLALLARQAKDR